MAVRKIVKTENGYRIVGRKGLVWLVKPNGEVVNCSTWRPRCEGQAIGARAALATLAVMDERMNP